MSPVEQKKVNKTHTFSVSSLIRQDCAFFFLSRDNSVSNLSINIIKSTPSQFLSLCEFFCCALTASIHLQLILFFNSTQMIMDIVVYSTYIICLHLFFIRELSLAGM